MPPHYAFDATAAKLLALQAYLLYVSSITDALKAPLAALKAEDSSLQAQRLRMEDILIRTELAGAACHFGCGRQLARVSMTIYEVLAVLWEHRYPG